MKHRISSNLRWNRYIFIGIGIILIYVLINSVSNNDFESKEIIIFSLIVISSFVFAYIFNKAKTLEFDNEFLYISNSKGEEKIPLRKIYKIKMINANINNRSIWKIGYYDKNGIDKVVRILPRWFYKNFDEFKELVQKENKEVKLKNWSHSFDIDM